MFTFILHLLTVWVFNPYSIYYEKLVQKYFFKNDYNFLKSGVYFLVMSVFFKPQNRTILPFHSHPINSRPHSIDQWPLLPCPWMPAVSQKKKKRNVKKNCVAIIMIIIDLYGLFYNEISICKKFHDSQRHICNPVEHLRWRFFGKISLRHEIFAALRLTPEIGEIKIAAQNTFLAQTQKMLQKYIFYVLVSWNFAN